MSIQRVLVLFFRMAFVELGLKVNTAKRFFASDAICWMNESTSESSVTQRIGITFSRKVIRTR